MGDSAVTVDFGNTIDTDINRYIISLFEKISANPPMGMIEAVPAYSSITIFYNVFSLRKKIPAGTSAFEWMKQKVENILAEDINVNNTNSWVVRIPVCYENEFADDMEFVLAQKNISKEGFIESHTAETYRVYMLGFLPGFAYMGIVNDKIAMPRKQNPGPVEPGSVGIAGKQTGIYPLNSPGGWQIIGRTPLKMFKTFHSPFPNEIPKDDISLLRPGDTVEFYPISREEYFEMERKETETQKSISVEPENGKKEKPGIRIIRQGILDTIQDMGRYDHQYLGINPTGAMDRFAAQAINIIAGNDPNEGLIEMHFPAPILLFEQEALIAIGGADFMATINGEPAPLWQPIIVSKNSLLEFQHWKEGARCYLAVKQKLDLPLWLNSYSTNIKAECGGFRGRSLYKDDVVAFKHQCEYKKILQNHDHIILPWKADVHVSGNDSEKIAVLKGKEWDWLTDKAKKNFLQHSFTIDSSADRMGYRLQGHLSAKTNTELVSAAVGFGTIQLLPNGELIVLMADHQTTGGYPRIAHVATTELSKLAQKKPGEKISFEFIDQDAAEELMIKEKQHLLQLQNASAFRMEEFFTAYAHH